MGSRRGRGPIVTDSSVVFTGSAATYAMTNEAYLVIKRASGLATAVTLPAMPAGIFRTVFIKDGKGDATTNNITISPVSGNIDGSSAPYVIENNYGAVMFFYNGVEWEVINTFGGSSGVPGGANSSLKITRTVTGLTDNTATLLATITVPNILLGAALNVAVVGTTGDGDSTNVALYTCGLARIAGAAANATLSTKSVGATTTGVTATAVTTLTLGSVGGAVGATNTFALNVTVAKGAGSSTLHTATAEITVLNTYAGGVTVD